VLKVARSRGSPELISTEQKGIAGVSADIRDRIPRLIVQILFLKSNVLSIILSHVLFMLFCIIYTDSVTCAADRSFDRQVATRHRASTSIATQPVHRLQIASRVAKALDLQLAGCEFNSRPGAVE